MGKTVRFLQERCVGCGCCAIACLDEHDKSLCRLETSEQAVDGRPRVAYLLRLCRHCANAPCVSSCPTHCFTTDGDTGLVQLASGSCIGCGRCLRVCPFGAVFLVEKRAYKCDGCLARVRAGRLPRCVESCPYGALAYR